MGKGFGDWVEIFRAGKHTDMGGNIDEYTENDLDEIVETFKPVLHRPPAVIGHPKTDDKAMAWVEAVKREGDVLLAKFEKVLPAFEEAVKQGSFRNRSVSLYPRNSPVNPAPGMLVLKHVGWLGATAPAVKGLADVDFAERSLTAEFAGQDGVTYEFAESENYKFGVIGNALRSLKNWMIEKFGLDTADKVILDYEIDDIKRRAESDGIGYNEKTDPEEDKTMNEKEWADNVALAEKERDDAKAKYAESQTAIAEKDKRIAEYAEAEKKAKEDAKKTRITAFAEKMMSDRKLTAKDKDDLVAFAMSLDESETLAFSEGKKSGLDYFFKYAENSKTVVPDGKAAYTKANAAGGKDALKFGEDVDPERAELHEKALKYCEEHPEATYAEAIVKLAGKED